MPAKPLGGHRLRRLLGFLALTTCPLLNGPEGEMAREVIWTLNWRTPTFLALSSMLEGPMRPAQ